MKQKAARQPPKNTALGPNQGPKTPGWARDRTRPCVAERLAFFPEAFVQQKVLNNVSIDELLGI